MSLTTEAPLFKTRDAGDLLPPGWQEDITTRAPMLAKRVDVDGKGPGSLEEEDTAGLHYWVVTGDVIKVEFPYLWDLYAGEFLNQVNDAVAPLRCKVSQFMTSAININVVKGRGARYENHLDSHPFTALLYVTPPDTAGGGALRVEVDGGKRRHWFRAGTFLIFDGSRIPHAVEPLQRDDDLRISVPMNYPMEDYQERASGLDAHMYGADVA